MGALSLWALDVVREFVGVVAGTGMGRGILSSVLGAGVCVVLWIRRRVGLWIGFGWGGWGGFGWLPIGPCDRFFPWWGWIWRTVRRGRVQPVWQAEPLWRDSRRCMGARDSRTWRTSTMRTSEAALSTVGAGSSALGRTTAVAATHAQLSGARMMTGNLPVVPSRASLSASGRAAAASTIHNSGSQHFFGTQSTSHPESFQQQTAHLQQSMQQSHFSPVTAGARATGPVSTESRKRVGSRSREAERRHNCAGQRDE